MQDTKLILVGGKNCLIKIPDMFLLVYFVLITIRYNMSIILYYVGNELKKKILTTGTKI